MWCLGFMGLECRVSGLSGLGVRGLNMFKQYLTMVPIYKNQNLSKVGPPP